MPVIRLTYCSLLNGYMMNKRLPVVFIFFLSYFCKAQSYPQNYFRHPLNIPMQLVANFGEIRTNHWHMGLDIRTQQKVNLPVYAAAEGYISRVSVEPGGFGQAIYIDHPNGYTTVYGHLNSFFPALGDYVKQKQYEQQSWNVSLILPANLFAVKKGDLIALSGSTGASEGPHVHFEIRDTKTENCLNPLLFKFPIADAVPPGLTRLAMYDRNRSTWEQSPQLVSLKKTGAFYTIPGNSIRVGSNKISFAVGAVDRFSGTNNPNGIYSAKISMDGNPISEFLLDDISYNDTRYINAQLDYPYKARGGTSLQHITPLPGATDVAYHLPNGDGVIHLDDTEPHEITIEIGDVNGNTSKLQFSVVYDETLKKTYASATGERFFPNNVNIFERDHFELFTTEKTIYDTIAVSYTETGTAATNAISPLFSFFSAAIPSHDSVTVRIHPTEDVPAEWTERVIIKNTSGSRTYVEKAQWQNGWYAAKFRQFGTYQAFIDKEPPSVNAPPANLSKSARIVFIPKDNFNTIKGFRAELDGQWLRFTNDKGQAWIYSFDEHFPKGEHDLKLIVEDEAGNITTKIWHVTR
jgi:hypothetical protein